MKRLPRPLLAIIIAFALATPLAVLVPRAFAAKIDTSSNAAFIKSIAPMAQEGQRRYGVPASVAMAQAILESGWGKSGLTKKANAFFGIKCSAGNHGKHASGCITMRTREVINGRDVYVNAQFRRYSDPTGSFLDHGAFLRENGRYAKAFKYTDNPNQFIREVHKAGYATDPNYTKLIVGIMKSNNLYQYNNITKKPTKSASAKPTKTATKEPSKTATAKPSKTATATPTGKPTKTATPTKPVKTATAEPTKTATTKPTAQPTTQAPTTQPTRTPRAGEPTATPTTPPVDPEPTDPGTDDEAPVTPDQPQDPEKSFPEEGGLPGADTARPAGDTHAAPTGDTAPVNDGGMPVDSKDSKDSSGGLAKTGC